MAVRLIALDIDGTLLDSRWCVPEANRLAIAKAARRGIEVALVTGRRYDFAMPVARELDAPITMIVNNGALVRTHDGQTHIRHVLPAETARKVLQLTLPWRDGAALIFDRLREKQVMLEVLDPNDTLRYGYYARNRDFIGVASPLESCLTEDPIQVMFSGPVAEMRKVEAILRASLRESLRETLLDAARDAAPESTAASTNASPRVAAGAADFALAVTVYEAKDFAMIDVLNPIITKGVALSEWAALRGIAREEVLAIGDNHNDLEMLTFAGIPVVMGNGVSALKCFGWHQTTSNDEGGVAAAIEQFALREAASCV